MNNLQHTLEITAQNQPAVLERLLQVTRYRGFSVDGFSVNPNQNSTHLEIKMTVHDDENTVAKKENNIRKLFNQLTKLFDVDNINLKQTSTFQYQVQGYGNSTASSFSQAQTQTQQNFTH